MAMTTENVQQAKSIKSSEVETRVKRILAMSDDLMVTLKEVESVGDRFFGGSPEACDVESTPYSDGLLGSMDRAIDRLQETARGLAREVDRISSL